VLTTSLGAEDMVLTDLIARHRLPIALATLDTGKLHAQTLALIPQIEARYGLAVERWQPPAEQVMLFVRRMANWPCARAWPCARPAAHCASWNRWRACCRAARPGSRACGASSPAPAPKWPPPSWTTPAAPSSTPWPTGAGPMSGTTSPLHDVPYNPLHDEFFPSIGCEPCTRAVALGEDFRAGRWWWEQEDAKECGLHVSHAPQHTAKETA
jgi:phosphoadenosine phosphosulfate reductase